MLLYLFLKRNYGHVDIVFIRHTYEAEEVDEETFFHARETGGTVVSSAARADGRSSPSGIRQGDWNIYAAQASDGDNMSNDNAKSAALLENVILPMCQYFAYIEVSQDYEGGLGGALGATLAAKRICGERTSWWRNRERRSPCGRCGPAGRFFRCSASCSRAKTPRLKRQSAK